MVVYKLYEFVAYNPGYILLNSSIEVPIEHVVESVRIEWCHFMCSMNEWAIQCNNQLELRCVADKSDISTSICLCSNDIIDAVIYNNNCYRFFFRCIQKSCVTSINCHKFVQNATHLRLNSMNDRIIITQNVDKNSIQYGPKTLYYEISNSSTS